MRDNSQSSVFYIHFLRALFLNIYKNHKQNYDYYRFKSKGIMESVFNFISKLIAELVLKKIKNKFLKIEKNFDDFEYLYNHLDDEESKVLLIKLVCYRILGFRRMKLPTNDKEYWENINKIEDHKESNKKIEVDFNKWDLHLISLKKLGYNVELYQRASQINALFF